MYSAHIHHHGIKSENWMGLMKANLFRIDLNVIQKQQYYRHQPAQLYCIVGHYLKWMGLMCGCRLSWYCKCTCICNLYFVFVCCGSNCIGGHQLNWMGLIKTNLCGRRPLWYSLLLEEVPGHLKHCIIPLYFISVLYFCWKLFVLFLYFTVFAEAFRLMTTL